MDAVLKALEIVTRLPSWVWIVMTILFVGYQLDRRLEYIWKLIYELPEKLDQSSGLPATSTDQLGHVEAAGKSVGKA